MMISKLTKKHDKHDNKIIVNDKLNITLTKQIKHNLGYSIIPILISSLDSDSLYNIISDHIIINTKYKSILEHIEHNIKHNNINMSSITINDNTIYKKNTTSTTNSNTTGNKKSLRRGKYVSHNNSVLFTNMHQIFIISINNKSFNKIDNSELLESLRVAGNIVFNIIKANNIKAFNLINLVNLVKIVKIVNKQQTRQQTQNSIHDTLYIETILEGILLSSYKFIKYKTSQALNTKTHKYQLNNINLVTQSDTLDYRIKKLNNIINSVFMARDLINEPAILSKSTTFINIIKQFIKKNKLNIKLKIYDKKEIESLGMGLLLGVSKGSSSENAPKILIMKYYGSTHTLHDTQQNTETETDTETNTETETETETETKTETEKETNTNTKKDNEGKHNNSNPSYVLLGKGITFDTGGINLKSGRSMVEMKSDLSGAATVSSFLLGYAMNNGTQSINVICPFAENSIGPDAIKPSDILTSYNGTTVEITNTDAEGRLILADCLAYIVDKYPKSIIIDFATLTGQQESLSSKMFSNILSVNSDIEVNKLIECGKKINELLVPLPLMEQHLNKLRSYVADIKNVSFTSSADIIMSSLFMRQFIHKKTKWIHIDIAGPSFKLDELTKYSSPEASGIGVRLLFNYFDTIRHV